MLPSILFRPPRQFTFNNVRRYTKFIPRSHFPLPPNNPFTWFPGHMLVGLRSLSATITDIDLIIETRDARIPLSSRNPYLEDVCAHKRRLVLYNKRDLAGLTERQEQVPNPGCLCGWVADGRGFRSGIVDLGMRLCLLMFMTRGIY